jgi:geranylgeranyl pyrophosphate synthase
MENIGSRPVGKKREKLVEKALAIFRNRGRKASGIAMEAILSANITHRPVKNALIYFIKETWFGVQHPGLISLACEAVGGGPRETDAVGAAMIFLTGAADVHDDLIDQSEQKGSKLTVLGKFGGDVTLLAGDALLFLGLNSLHNACHQFSEKKRELVTELTTKAFFELGSAEAEETELKGKLDVNSAEFLKISKKKGSITEAYAKIGAIIGNGTQKEIESLGRYGRALGTLTTIRDDFIDMFEPHELQNRLRSESLPLPIAYALEDENAKRKIISILNNDEISEHNALELVQLVYETRQVQNLIKQISKLKEEALRQLKTLDNSKACRELKTVIKAAMEDLK